MEEKNLAVTSKSVNPVVFREASIFLDIKRFEEAQRVGGLLASSTLVPDHFKKSVANCVIALNLADRLCIDPFMLMQNMYVVHGRPGIEGKLAIALIEGTGRFSPLKFKFEGSAKTDKGIPRPDSCIAYATELKTGELIEGPPVTWDMAVAEGWTKAKGTEISKWQTLPDLMFRYRSAMFFARVNCPGALLGLRSVDEIEELGSIPMRETSPGQYQADVTTETDPEDKLKTFTDSIPKNTDETLLTEFLTRTADANKSTVDEVKISASENLKSFWKIYAAWVKQKKAEAAEKVEKKEEVVEMAPGECPNAPGTTFKKSYCDACKDRPGCPVWA